MKKCFFIGHRDAPEELFEPLYTAVLQHIEEFGVTEFIVGQYGAFDRLATRAVHQAKTHHPSIRLTLLLPYLTLSQPDTLTDIYDGSLYPEGLESTPKRYAIPKANRYMVEHSDFLIAYAWQPASNARKLTDFAKRREKQGLLRVCELPRPLRTSKISE